ncbi:MAG: hypothetical protein Q8M29_08625 [Bacteroidota bacterium]|nr:hypothetical protein [Bacteroidota bacterium]
MTNNEHVEALNDIRKMMKRSSRFLSLSGLSGVFAGLYALGGAWVAYTWQIEYLKRFFLNRQEEYRDQLDMEFFAKFGILALVILSLSLATGLFFSAKKAKQAGQKLLDHGAKLLLANLAVPLFAGGAFCLLLILRGDILLVAPALLIFYGISLLAAGKYTLDEVRYLGICEVVLGLINGFFFLGEGLLFWAIGFGVLHIVYGSLMWNKYDRVK